MKITSAAGNSRTRNLAKQSLSRIKLKAIMPGQITGPYRTWKSLGPKSTTDIGFSDIQRNKRYCISRGRSVSLSGKFCDQAFFRWANGGNPFPRSNKKERLITGCIRESKCSTGNTWCKLPSEKVDQLSAPVSSLFLYYLGGLNLWSQGKVSG